MEHDEAWHAQVSDEEYVNWIPFPPEVPRAVCERVRARVLEFLRRPPPDLHRLAMEATLSIGDYPADFRPSDVSTMLESLGGAPVKRRRWLAYAAAVRDLVLAEKDSQSVDP